MEKTTFILVFSLVIQTIAVKQIRKNEALKFLGYDCNKPTRLNSKWCMPVKTPENPKGDKTEGTKLTVIQKFGSQNVKGIKCSKRVSKLLEMSTHGDSLNLVLELRLSEEFHHGENGTVLYT